MWNQVIQTLQSVVGGNSRGVGDGESVAIDVAPTERAIEHLLRENGGRLRQQEIIEAADWSPATVSRRLSRLEAEGRIRRIRAGREKIVCLPGTVPKTPGLRKIHP